MDNKFLISFPKKGVYYFDNLDQNRICCTYTILEDKGSKAKRYIYCFLVRLLYWLPLFSHINDKVCKKYYNHRVLESINNCSGIVIYDTYLDADLLLYIKKHDVKRKVFVFAWNNLSVRRANLFSKFVGNDNIYSYSKEQAKQYGFQYHNDVLLTSLKLNKRDIKYDFYFLGDGKQRERILNEFGNVLNKSNYNYLFEVWGENNPEYPNVHFYNKYVPYQDYLDTVSASRCIVDFVTHHNISFRTIESFVFGKKLISNNVALKEYDFYNENNVLVIDLADKDLLGKIDHFLNTPLVQIDEEIIKRYDIYSFYEFFKNKADERK